MGFKHKALVCLMALTLLCSGTYTGISAEEELALSDSLEVAEETNKEAAQEVPEKVRNLLKFLGLMDESEIDSAGYVSRGVAAAVLLRFNKAFGEGTATGTMYTDVSADTVYAYEIETASACGYFFGTGDGKFSPDNSIMPAQMATVLLRLAGYPEKNIQSSSERGKLINCAANYDYLTYPNLANMLYTFLDINVVEIGGKLSGERVKSSKTVLNFFFDIYRFEGVISETGATGLWSGSDLKKNSVVLVGNNENIVLNKGDTDIDLMLGKYVEAYYEYDNNKWESVCVYYYVTDVPNNVKEIDLFRIDYNASTASQIVYYTADGKKNRVNYSAKTAVLYNGTYYDDTTPILNKVKGKEGTISVIDNNDDNEVDIFNIEAYDTYIVSSVVLSESKVFFKNITQPLSLDAKDYDQFILRDADGNDCFIEDFVDGTVVSVAQNSAGSDTKIIKVLVSEQTVNGIVTSAYQNDFGKDVVQLDSMDEYILLKNVDVPNSGQGVTFLLNAFGRVAWIDYSNSGEFAYGIITKVKKDKKEDSVLIKMITAQNTIETFEVKTKLSVDRTTYKDMDTLYTKLERLDNISVGNHKLPAGVYPVRYKLRKDGTLQELDTDKRDIAAGENENTLELLTSGYNLLQSELVMGGAFALKSSTPVFRISGSTSSGIIEKEYFDDTQYTDMSNVSDLLGTNKKYNYAAYKVDKDSLYADFMIVSSTWGQGYEDKLFVIEKITSVYDEVSDSVVKCVHGIENGVEKQLVVSDFYEAEFDGIGLGCGDVIRYKADGYGQLIYVEDVSSNSWVVKHNISSTSKTIDINNISSGRTSLSDFKNEAYSTQMIFGYVKERRGNYITLSVIQPGTHNLDGKRSTADMGKETVLIKIPDTVPITVYDPTKTDKVFTATYDEILDYKHNSCNCSLVALHFRTGRLLDAVVLNDYSLYQ